MDHKHLRTTCLKQSMSYVVIANWFDAIVYTRDEVASSLGKK